MQEKVAERKCPQCGVSMKPDAYSYLLALGLEGARCMDKSCPPFETWPEVKHGPSAQGKCG